MANTLDTKQDYPNVGTSGQWLARAEKVIPARTQTLAKGPQSFIEGVCPAFVDRAKGSHLFDVDGNEYLDLVMGVGPLVLGYSDERVDNAIREQLAKGITYSLLHTLEVELAELVRSVVPCAEMVRYSKTGADVCSAAIRLSRAYTGRNKVLCCGYHGWHDWYVSTMPLNAGVPASTAELTHTFSYNDIDSVKNAIDDDTACVILEPTVFAAPENDFLNELRQLCTEKNIVLIFDEMWTGFRLATGGAQEYFDVKPDLAVFSKAVANGMPLALLTGKEDIMRKLDEDIFFYTTFGGEALSLAAAKATIEILRDEKICDSLHQKGKTIRENLDARLQENGIDFIKCVGHDPRTLVQISDHNDISALEIKSYLQQEMVKRGVLWSGFHSVSAAFSDADIAHLDTAYAEALPLVAAAVESGDVASKVRGPLLQPLLRKTSGFNTKPKANS